MALIVTLDQMDIRHFLEQFIQKLQNIHFPPSAHGAFFRMDHILGHKISFHECKNIEITSSIFSEHNSIKLEINYRNKTEKHKCVKTKAMNQELK